MEQPASSGPCRPPAAVHRLEDLWVPKSRLECCEKEKSEIERERNELETENKRCRAQLAEHQEALKDAQNAVAVGKEALEAMEKEWERALETHTAQTQAAMLHEQNAKDTLQGQVRVLTRQLSESDQGRVWQELDEVKSKLENAVTARSRLQQVINGTATEFAACRSQLAECRAAQAGKDYQLQQGLTSLLSDISCISESQAEIFEINRQQILQEASTGQGWLLPDLAGQDVDTQVKALRQHILSLRWKYDDVERRLRISEEERDAARKQEEVLGNALQDSRSALSDIERRLEENRSMLKQTQDELYKARNQVVIHEGEAALRSLQDLSASDKTLFDRQQAVLLEDSLTRQKSLQEELQQLKQELVNKNRHQEYLHAQLVQMDSANRLLEMRLQDAMSDMTCGHFIF